MIRSGPLRQIRSLAWFDLCRWRRALALTLLPMMALFGLIEMSPHGGPEAAGKAMFGLGTLLSAVGVVYLAHRDVAARAAGVVLVRGVSRDTYVLAKLAAVAGYGFVVVAVVVALDRIAQWQAGEAVQAGAWIWWGHYVVEGVFSLVALGAFALVFGPGPGAALYFTSVYGFVALATFDGVPAPFAWLGRLLSVVSVPPDFPAHASGFRCQEPALWVYGAAMLDRVWVAMLYVLVALAVWHRRDLR